MQGAPVAAATGGPQAQPRPDLLGEVAVDVLCWKCGGAGERLRKVKRPRKASRRSVEAGTDAAAPAVAAEATAALALVAHTCTVCGGSGRLGSGSAHHAPALPRKVRPTKVLEGWDPPGPAPVGEQGDPELREGPAEELCYLLGQWRIFQPLKGHRYSTDDVVTAWCARAWCTALRKPVRRAMDIGCGIGSVLLMTAWLFPDARCDGVEAQAERYHLARRSVRYNLGAGCDRVRVQNGDLRCAEPPAGGGGFDLVTGTPPYWDVAVGGLPQTMGRARCLFEFFGGIEDYCATAARLLAPDGLFVVCNTAPAHARSLAAARRAGLRVLAHVAVVPREGRPSLFRVYCMARGAGESGGGAEESGGGAASGEGAAGGGAAHSGSLATDASAAAAGAVSAADTAPAAADPAGQALAAAPAAECAVPEVLCVRKADGARTAAYLQLLRDMGKPPSER